MNLNVATVLELIWEYMGLLRIYTKKRAEPPSFEEWKRCMRKSALA